MHFCLGVLSSKSECRNYGALSNPNRKSKVIALSLAWISSTILKSKYGVGESKLMCDCSKLIVCTSKVLFSSWIIANFSYSNNSAFEGKIWSIEVFASKSTCDSVFIHSMIELERAMVAFTLSILFTLITLITKSFRGPSGSSCSTGYGSLKLN